MIKAVKNIPVTPCWFLSCTDIILWILKPNVPYHYKQPRCKTCQVALWELETFFQLNNKKASDHMTTGHFRTSYRRRGSCKDDGRQRNEVKKKIGGYKSKKSLTSYHLSACGCHGNKSTRLTVQMCTTFQSFRCQYRSSTWLNCICFGLSGLENTFVSPFSSS